MNFSLNLRLRDDFAFCFYFVTNDHWERRLNTNHKLAYAISAILSGYAGTSFAAPAAADVADTTDTGGIEEIQVTAQRRVEAVRSHPLLAFAPFARVRTLRWRSHPL